MKREPIYLEYISYNKLWQKIAECANERLFLSDKEWNNIKTQAEINLKNKGIVNVDKELVKELSPYLKSITPTALFKRLGISTQTLSVLKNNGSVSLSTIDKLCSYFKCQPCDIMEFLEE